MYWLPELLVGLEDNINSAAWSASVWSGLPVAYGTGVVLSALLFITRLSKLVYLIRRLNTVAYGKLKIAESNDDKPSFSFFHFVFLGQCQHLTEKERIHIVEHESIHARKLHSFDIILINVVGVFFWFNPVIWIYKKIFIQLHEFEADSLAVKNHEVDGYCNLLAKVALMSADIRLGNYFNHSFTLKRIEMMRTIKTRIRRWKIAVVPVFPLLFFIAVSCQDHFVNEVANTTLSQTAEIPSEVKADMAALEKQYPDETVAYMEGGDVIIQGKSLAEWQQSNATPRSILKTYHFKDRNSTGVIALLKNAHSKESDLIVDGVYRVVEESASPVSGMAVFYKYIASNLLYPAQARRQGIEGKVLVEFTVLEDGNLTDFKVIKGLDPSVDVEAIRVLQNAPAWKPGRNNGVPVKQRMVLPIAFRLG